MNIHVGIGLDNIVFGMKQEEVSELLGTPDRINELSEELENKIVFYYNNLMLKLKFDKQEDNKLYSIETTNPKVILFNKKLIGLNKSELLILLKENNITNYERDDYTSFDTLFCEEIWTTFEFEFDKIRSIEFSPLFKNDNEIVWP